MAAREGSSYHKVVNIGSLVLEWRRASSPLDCPAVITELTFPSVTVESVPFFIHTGIPLQSIIFFFSLRSQALPVNPKNIEAERQRRERGKCSNYSFFSPISFRVTRKAWLRCFTRLRMSVF